MPQETTQGIIIFFDIAAFIIMAIILFSVYFRKMVHGKVNKWFIILCYVTIITQISDFITSRFSTPEQLADVPNFLFYLVHTPYFFLRAIILPVYTMFIIAKAGYMSHIRKESLHNKLLIAFPLIVAVIALIINPFKPFLFEKSEDFGYHRLSGMYLLYVIAAYYMVISVIVTFRFKKIFSKTEFISLFLMAPFQIAAVTIQFFNSNLLVELFATTCSILIITITVHRPELLLHWDFGTYTKHAYLDELQRIVQLERPVTILFVNIKNFSDITAFLPYHILTQAIQNRVAAVEANKTAAFKEAQSYYLENGLFAIVTDQTSKEEAKVFSGIINNLLAETLIIDGIEIHLIPQICYFDSPNDISGYESLFSFIQSFQYLIPNQKEPVDAATITGTKNFKINNDIDSILTKAIRNNSFQMYYQPIWSVTKKKFISAEALIRLPDEKYGFVSPELFIAAAEKNGAIYQIGDFIIEDVCRFIASDEFKKSGLEYIEINLAVAQCLQPDLPQKIRTCVEKYGIAFSQLNLEITERETIADQALFDRNIDALSEMGMTLSLDDYGTGYSNIQRITAMPLNIVKIDKSFVDRKDDENMQIIICKTISMMKALEKEIVVEGIEDEDTVNFFTDLNCDFIQGYFFSKPLPEKEFLTFCTERNAC